MAELTTSEVFEGSIEDVFEGIRQYNKYPEYLPGVTGIAVLPARKKGSVCQVRYELKLIKSFHYILDMFEERPSRIWWELDSSNIMKANKGSWELKEKGPGKTEAVYRLDVGFSGFVPQKIVDQISKANLPLMMRGFQKLISDSRKA